MDNRRSKVLALVLGLAFLTSPLVLIACSPNVAGSPVVIDTFSGGTTIANLTFIEEATNRSLAIEIPRGATVTKAALAIEGVPGLVPKIKQLDFVNGRIGTNVWAYHEEDKGIHPPSVGPLTSGWTGANKKEYTNLDKNDQAYWSTSTNVVAIPPPDPPIEWPMQLFHFNPGITNASSLFISWLGRGWCAVNQTNPGHAELWLYNHTGSRWEEVANYSSRQAVDAELNHTAKAPIPYISTNGSIDAIVVGAHSDTVRQRVGQGQLLSDYIEVRLEADPVLQYPYDVTLEIGGTNVTTYYDYLEGELVIDEAQGLDTAIQAVIDRAEVLPGDLVIPFNFSVGNQTVGKVQVRDLEIEYEPVVNLPPVWNGPEEVETEEDLPWTDVIDLFAAFPDDHNTGALNFQVVDVSDPANLSARIGWWDGNRSLEVQGAPDFFGEAQVKVRAIDRFGASTNSSWITVRVFQTPDAPRLADPGAFTIKEGDTLEHVFSVEDPDLPDDELTFSSSSDWVAIDEATGRIEWTPSSTQVGPHRFVVSVTDRFDLTTYLTVNIMVTDVNEAPTISSVLEMDAVQDEVARYTIRAEDADVPFGDRLTYEAFADGVVLDVEAITGLMSFNPTNSHVPGFEITLRATDSLGEQGEAVLYVNVENRNDPPVLEGMGPYEYYQNDAISLQLVATDPDLGLDIPVLETLTFGTTGPEGFAADEDGMIELVPDQSLVGEHSIIYTVTDGGGKQDSMTVVFTIIDVNDPPDWSFAAIEVGLKEDVVFDVTFTAEDPDGDELTYSDDSDLFDIDPVTGKVVFTPGQLDVDLVEFTITASDGRGGTAAHSESISYSYVNDAPVITAIGPDDGSEFEEGKKVTLSVTVTDEEGDELTITWKEGEKVLGTGANVPDLKFKPGKHTVVLTIDDGTEVVTEEVEFTVLESEEEPGFPAALAVLAIVGAMFALVRRRK